MSEVNMIPASWTLMERAGMAEAQDSFLVFSPKDHDKKDWETILFALRECEKNGYLQVKMTRKKNRYAAEITEGGKRALRRWRWFQAEQAAVRFQEMWAKEELA